MIGDSALKTVPRGGDPLDKELKNEMPKDAYAMWNKLNKSLIGPTSGDRLECTDCGECIAVCPVDCIIPDPDNVESVEELKFKFEHIQNEQ